MVLGAVGAAVGMWRHSPAVVATPAVAPSPVAAVVALSAAASLVPSAPSSVSPPIAASVSIVAPPTMAAITPPPPAGIGPPAFAITLASEADILADRPTELTIFRFKPNPAIVVLDFASLDTQARMLNRVAVFEEKAGYPHDRLLSDQELEKAIRGGGDEPATFYYGHDYRAAAVVRFFAVADRDRVTLTDEEQRLRALIVQLGWEGPEPVGALISLPRLDANPLVDLRARATILRHELSHGEYFTNPEYFAYVHRFWRSSMTDPERNAFKRFLVADHYDGTIDDLIVNETVAYLIHTPDARFFAPSFVNLPQTRIEALREAFVSGMPKGWLRDVTPPAGGAFAPMRMPRRRRPVTRRGPGASRHVYARHPSATKAGPPSRRPHCLAAVSSTSASALIRASRLRAASTAALSATR